MSHILTLGSPAMRKVDFWLGSPLTSGFRKGYFSRTSVKSGGKLRYCLLKGLDLRSRVLGVMQGP